MVVHGITLNTWDAIDLDDFRAGDAEFFEFLGIISEALGIGPDGGGRN